MLLVEARQKHLAQILPECMKEYGLRTALDAGCGVGYFFGFLLDLGFEVTAFDARPANIDEARRRHPGVSFHVADMEDGALERFGQFDFVLCYGLIITLRTPCELSVCCAGSRESSCSSKGWQFPTKHPLCIFATNRQLKIRE